MSGTRWRKVPSLSSASTTIHSPVSHAALVPISLTSPPIRKDGCRPASTRISASMEAVVVLPWVPATAMHRRRAAIPASASARLRTGTPSRRASTSSGLSAVTAVEWVTSAAPATWSARWPIETSIPTDRRRSVTVDSFRSLPDTSWPMACRTVAMALMPAPPTPTTWILRTAVGSPDTRGRRGTPPRHPDRGVIGPRRPRRGPRPRRRPPPRHRGGRPTVPHRPWPAGGPDRRGGPRRRW